MSGGKGGIALSKKELSTHTAKKGSVGLSMIQCPISFFWVLSPGITDIKDKENDKGTKDRERERSEPLVRVVLMRKGHRVRVDTER